MTAPLLRLRQLTRHYGNERPALDSIDLDVMSGEWLSIVGKSGSGKSTLLNVIGLLDRPNSGTYELLGSEITGQTEADWCALRAHYFGFVFQAFHLVDHRTVAENVALGALHVGWRRKQREAAAREIMDRLGLSHRVAAKPRTLSGGERQRVAIARALMGQPKLLLCDEPTGNLDSENAANVMDVLRDLHQDGLSILVVTHDAEVAATGERTIRIADGQVVDSWQN
ncbi:ABC transporter ATP-binding protein [Krasilnikovia sp. M28-CT-15]|uniref:ABC transporter ATP-binding protein n=1 Tax=Krasilnikovia sp. M28-CT-15 TaxID=3373540 RepID=UPI0038765F78